MVCTNINITTLEQSFPECPSLHFSGVETTRREVCLRFESKMKLEMWSSEGHCGHQSSLELVNIVANLLAPLAGKGQQLGPQLPYLPSSPSVSLSLPLLLLQKTYIVKAVGSERRKFVLMGVVSSHVLACLHSPVSGPSFLSNSLSMATSDHHQTWAAFRSFFTRCHNCMSTPYTKSLIPYHSWWFHSLIDGWQRIMAREQSLYPNQRTGNESLAEFQYPCPGIVPPPWILASPVTHFWLIEYGRSEAPWLWG